MDTFTLAGFDVPLWIALFGLVAAVVTMLLVPRGQRWAAAIPVAGLLVLTMALAAYGRTQLNHDEADAKLASEKAATKSVTETYEKACVAAERFATNGLYDAARDQLVAAYGNQPESPDPEVDAHCTTARTTLAAAAPDTTDDIDVVTNAAASESDDSEDTVPIQDAVQRGVEGVATDVLDEVLPGGTGSDGVTLGPAGWLAFAFLLLLAITAWTRIVGFLVRRVTTPQVSLNDLVDGDGETKSLASLTAELRRRLFEDDVPAAARPVASVSDDIAGVFEDSGVSGGKLAARFLTICRRLFGIENVVEASVTLHRCRKDEDTPDSGPTGPWRATLEVQDPRTKRTLTIKEIDNDDVSTLLLVISATIRHEALSRRSQLPSWQEWTAQALVTYLEALNDEQAAYAAIQGGAK